MDEHLKGNQLVRKTIHDTQLKEVNEEERTLIVRISTINPDRSNDVVHPKGAKFENYLKNPVVAAFHRYDRPAIAKTVEIQANDQDIVAKLEFAPKGVNPEADMLFDLYKGGFMNAWSIGFVPKKFSQRGESWSDGREFQEWELLEYSAVLVPDNAEALTMLRSKGFEPELQNEMKEIDESSDEKEVTAPQVTDEDQKEAKKLEVVSIESAEGTLSLKLSNDEVVSCSLEMVNEFVSKQSQEKANEFLKSIRNALVKVDKDAGLTLRRINEMLKGGDDEK
jgi:uncharacterized protein